MFAYFTISLSGSMLAHANRSGPKSLFKMTIDRPIADLPSINLPWGAELASRLLRCWSTNEFLITSNQNRLLQLSPSVPSIVIVGRELSMRSIG